MKRPGKIAAIVLAAAVLLAAPMAVPDLLFLIRPLPEQTAPTPFRFPADRFAFANETVWNYAHGELQSIGMSDENQRTSGGERYTRRCFVLCRAALQFHKFARFDPAVAPLEEDILAGRLRELVAIDVWKEPRETGNRIVFPGYPDLDTLSRAHPEMLQENLGPGWTTYVRPGNFGITLPVIDPHQEKIHRLLEQSLTLDMPVILWLVNFPSLDINHTVLVFRKNASAGGVDRYAVYDPNDATVPKELTYSHDEAEFSFQPTFYFPGGPCRARAVFLSPFQ